MLKLLTAVFVPPIGVFLQSGMGRRFYTNILLTLCGVFPGVVHAIWGLEGEKKGFRLDRLMGKS